MSAPHRVPAPPRNPEQARRAHWQRHRLNSWQSAPIGSLSAGMVKRKKGE